MYSIGADEDWYLKNIGVGGCVYNRRVFSGCEFNMGERRCIL